MLKIYIEPQELFDNKKQEFINIKGQTLLLEHSLVSISKWESKWKRPFISKNNDDKKTLEETLDYIKCMTITEDVDDIIYNCLSNENIQKINKYIEDPMTATTFYIENKNYSINREQITSELIYYWMVSSNIPIECEKWHINRLLTLIRIFSLKNTPPKKMSKKEIMSRNAALNAARRKKLNTSG